MSALWVKRWYGGGFNTALARLAQSLPRTITASPELFLPVACLFVWQVTATAVKPAALGLALLLTLLLFIYGYGWAFALVYGTKTRTAPLWH